MNDDKSVREQARRLAHKIRTMDQGYVTLDEATAKVEKVLEPLLAAKAEAWQVADALAEALKKATAEPPKKARKLNEREIREREVNIAKHYAKIRNLEREKKRITQDLSAKIKPLKKELDQWSEEVELKRELISQDELDFEDGDDDEIRAGASTPTVDQTAAALGEIAKHIGGNGKEPHDDLPPGAPPLADDLDTAMAAETAGAPV